MTFDSTHAIFFEWTMVMAVMLLCAIVGDRIDALRRHLAAQRAIARRLRS